MLSSFTAVHEPFVKASKKKSRQEMDTMSTQKLVDLVMKLSAQVESLQDQWNHDARRSTSSPKHEDEGLPPCPKRSTMVIDPMAPTVPSAYAALLQELDNGNQHHHCCCHGGVAVEPNIPWISLHGGDQTGSSAQVSYAHWCTLMRCLPMMDPVSQEYVRTVGLHAMRQLLPSVKKPLQGSSDGSRFYPIPDAVTSATLKNSFSCLKMQASDRIDPNQRRADAWIPHNALPQRENTGHWSTAPLSADYLSRTTELPVSPPPPHFSPLSMPSTVTLHSHPVEHTARKLRRWFKRTRVAPTTHLS